MHINLGLVKGGQSIQYCIRIYTSIRTAEQFPLLLYGLEVEVPPVSRNEVLSPSLEFVLFMDVMDRSIKTRFVDADEKCN